MRSSVATALFATVALMALFSHGINADQGSLQVGYRQSGDHLIAQEHIQKKAIPLFARDETVTITGDGLSKITTVEVIDTKNSDNNYTPKIIAGGPDYTFVTIKVASYRGHGLHYLIKVYGK